VNLYNYKLIDNLGDVIEGRAFARSSDDLVRSLDGIVVKCKKCRSNLGEPIESFTLPFLKNLHQLLKNRVELMTSLLITKQLFKDSEKKAIVDFIVRRIRSGCLFSDSISCFENCFDGFLIKAVGIAEKTGRLPVILGRAAERLGSGLVVKKKVRSAVIYPTILFIFVSAVMIFWLLFIVPRFAELFADIGMDVSGLTNCVLAISSFGNSHVILFLILFLSPLPALFLLSKSKRFMKHVPIFGIIQRELLVMNFFYCMSIVAQEKFNLLDGIDCLGDTDGSNFIKCVSVSIRDGNSLSASLKKCGVFKDYEIAIVEAGEKSGGLAEAFQTAFEVSSSSLNDKLERITGLIQPVTIAFVGLLLLLITYSVITPIYSSIDMAAI
jgi:type IV pilus assembly protein PilC